jgi:hypothetical protein
VGETLLALLGRSVSPSTVSQVAKTLDRVDKPSTKPARMTRSISRVRRAEARITAVGL